MYLIQPSVTELKQNPGVTGIYQQIELAGRECYASSHLIKDGSAEAFTERMMKLAHGGMLEHGTVYLYVKHICKSPFDFGPIYKKYDRDPYSKIFTEAYNDVEGGDITYYIHGITTNLRVMFENNWMDDLQYICEPMENHAKRRTFRFETDRITGESFIRHRKQEADQAFLEDLPTIHATKFSFARQSTRYCNFSKDKFGNEIVFVLPTNVDIPAGKYDYTDDLRLCHNEVPVSLPRDQRIFVSSCISHEEDYFDLLKEGWKPEQARYVLGFSILSPLVMTAYEEDWQHFLELRCDSHAHPDAQYLANIIKDELW